MMCTKMILALSLLTWRARRAAQGLMQPASRRPSTTTTGASPAPFAAVPPAASQKDAGKEAAAPERTLPPHVGCLLSLFGRVRRNVMWRNGFTLCNVI
ncbi:hypothetical protein DUNSADRAFT_10408 [Dunaliella salina]|uniref:Secreted protein n=1 Tax=Dunaliella salina TaxID=3046 RepID=A0ABQ7GFE1_DUNSA|nr:hypothetical protein DUNSADRAFT_10408 [Dunaliella salina]|eukprot:KAF5833328.1 hypothetical protein DUNSADRAFT_10408 [Dunaliella salina]